MYKLLSFNILVVLTSLIPLDLGAQGLTIDEGTFRVTRNGAEVGTETFAIRQSGSGAALQTLAAARLHLRVNGESRHLIPRLLMVGEAYRFQGYESKVSGDRQMDVELRRDGERVVARTTSAQGERMRELRLPPQALVLDAFVAHHFHFVGARIQRGVLTFGLLPTGGTGGRATVSDRGQETVRIAGTDVAASRYDLQAGDRSWSAWFDEQWRVLVVEAPNGYRAERQALP